MVWKKIVNKKNQISWENKKAEMQVMIFELDGWKGRYFVKGSGNIKWEGMDIQNYNSKEEALKWANDYMKWVERRYG